MNATTTIEPGTVVVTRPWRAGKQLSLRQGIVMAERVVGQHEHGYLVWFPSLGDPIPGKSVQGIFPNEIGEVVQNHPKTITFVRRAYAMSRSARRRGVWSAAFNPGGYAIERIARR